MGSGVFHSKYILVFYKAPFHGDSAMLHLGYSPELHAPVGIHDYNVLKGRKRIIK